MCAGALRVKSAKTNGISRSSASSCALGTRELVIDLHEVVTVCHDFVKNVCDLVFDRIRSPKHFSRFRKQSLRRRIRSNTTSCSIFTSSYSVHHDLVFILHEVVFVGHEVVFDPIRGRIRSRRPRIRSARRRLRSRPGRVRGTRREGCGRARARGHGAGCARGGRKGVRLAMGGERERAAA